MNTIQQGVITLLKSAVTQQALELPKDFDLAAAYPVVKRHHMSTLLYDGAVRCGISRTEPIMQKLFGQYCRLLMISERQMEEVQRIFRAFDEAEIDYMPLKGCVMKAYYPMPELRIMGDADILIRLEQYDRIVPVMEKLGFRAKQETDHELVWVSDGLFLELHKRLIPSYNEDYHPYFGDGWKLAKLREGTRFSMNGEDGFIYLFTHFAKHFRDGGIGCRHVLDLWVYRRAFPALDEDYIRSELEGIGLLKFYGHICRMLDVWFCGGAETPMSDFLTDAVFASGSFGTMENKALSMAVRDKKRNVLGFNSRLQYLWKTAFQSVDVLKDKYTVLKKAPWMLPVVWVVRPFYKVIFERKTLVRQERNLRALSEEGVDLRREALHAIGLDYDF